MKYDGFAFETPDIREIEHGAMGKQPACQNVGNNVDLLHCGNFNSLTGMVNVIPADTSFACFLCGEPGE